MPTRRRPLSSNVVVAARYCTVISTILSLCPIFALFDSQAMTALYLQIVSFVLSMFGTLTFFMAIYKRKFHYTLISLLASLYNLSIATLLIIVATATAASPSSDTFISREIRDLVLMNPDFQDIIDEVYGGDITKVIVSFAQFTASMAALVFLMNCLTFGLQFATMLFLRKLSTIPTSSRNPRRPQSSVSSLDDDDVDNYSVFFIKPPDYEDALELPVIVEDLPPSYDNAVTPTTAVGEPLEGTPSYDTTIAPTTAGAPLEEEQPGQTINA